MNMKTAAIMLTLTMLGSAPAFASVEEKPAAPAQKVEFFSGGIDEEGLKEIKDKQNAFGLKLMFAATSGHYLSDVGVKISDASNNVVLDAVSEGPYFLANLQPGSYKVDITYEGTSQNRKVSIGKSGRKELNFYFKTIEK